ncbi:MAG: D-2-hydroxyacid dehydrogenase [Verrucomicrobiota bacterium]
MNIVILDGYTANPGDLDWAPLEALGTLTVHDRTEPEEVVARCADAEVVLTNKCVLTGDALAALPKLRLVSVLATGTNIVDLKAARARGIPVCNVPGYSTPSVAQTVFALLLELTHAVGAHAREVAAGAWSRGPDFSFYRHSLVELHGLTLGIIGFGETGRATAAAGRAFGMRVLAQSRTPKLAEGVTFTDRDTLLRESDVVSLHCPLKSETLHLINAETLALMKPSAYLLNVARGPLVDEPALAEALNGGRLAGAGLDVLSAEPPPANNPLLSARNCLITPHYAWASLAARRRLIQMSAENLRAFQQANPVHVVN